MPWTVLASFRNSFHAYVFPTPHLPLKHKTSGVSLRRKRSISLLAGMIDTVDSSPGRYRMSPGMSPALVCYRSDYSPQQKSPDCIEALPTAVRTMGVFANGLT